MVAAVVEQWDDRALRRAINGVARELGQKTDLANATKAAVAGGGRELRKAIRAEAPRRTGKLRSSIQSGVRRGRDRGGYPVFYAVVGPTYPEGSAVNILHEGAPGRNIPANPFVKRGLDRSRVAVRAAKFRALRKWFRSTKTRRLKRAMRKAGARR